MGGDGHLVLPAPFPFNPAPRGAKQPLFPCSPQLGVTPELPAGTGKVFVGEIWCPRGAEAGEAAASGSGPASTKKPGVTGSDQPGEGCS